MTLTITHKYLRDILNNFSEENFDDFIVELQYSTLIVPVFENSVPDIKIRNSRCIPLFTDIYEFNKFSNGKFTPVDHVFNDYLDILDRHDIDGFVVNPLSESFIISRLILKDVEPIYIFEQDYRPFTTNEIRRFKNSINNEELNDFINDSSNLWDLDKIIDLINHSKVLTLLISNENFNDKAKDSVLSRAETGIIPKCLYDRAGKNYLLLFSDNLTYDPLPNSLEFKYTQIVNFPLLIEEVLNHDFDGFILNIDNQNITIPRENLRRFIKDFRCPNIDTYDMYSFTI